MGTDHWGHHRALAVPYDADAPLVYLRLVFEEVDTGERIIGEGFAGRVKIIARAFARSAVIYPQHCYTSARKVVGNHQKRFVTREHRRVAVDRTRTGEEKHRRVWAFTGRYR